jgi:hypothetical protein
MPVKELGASVLLEPSGRDKKHSSVAILKSSQELQNATPGA